MISFPENLVLENDYALLRPLQIQDVDFLLPFALQEPEIWTYSASSPIGEVGMTEYIAHVVEQRKLQTEYPFIVFDKKQKAYAGCTRFYDIKIPYLTTQLGYTWYGKKFQRTGLNRNCKLLLLSYAFEIWGMERVEFRADVNNHRSVTAMKNIGCTVEGIMRNNMPTATGSRRDSIVLSILKDEWFGFVKENLIKKIVDR
jgi:RimJ/RimL family protein N-acetyltransferase